MAFSFSQNTTPAFGATTPSFGASAPPIGVTPSFGAQQIPAFGAQQPGTTLFGVQATPSGTSLFGGAPALPVASQPAFGAQSQSAFSFGKPPAPAFGATPSPLFGAFGAAPTSLGISSFQPQQQQQQQDQYGGLTTIDGKPITHSTKWEEMSPACQNAFMQMQ
jgi:hypothetical protein